MKLISLTNGGFTIVDDDVYEWASKMRWFRGTDGYIRSTKAKNVLLHRLIMDTPDGMYTDHENHRLSDNRRCKLRLCTRTENQRNQKVGILYKGKPKSSKYKGVSKTWNGKKWQAAIWINGKRIHLGTFPTERRAALACNKAAKLYFGEFAFLNVID